MRKLPETEQDLFIIQFILSFASFFLIALREIKGVVGKAAFHDRALERHPDKGGSAAAFRELQAPLNT